MAYDHDGAPRSFCHTGPDGTGGQTAQEGIVSAMADDQCEGVFSGVDQDIGGFPGQHFGLDPDLGVALTGSGFGGGEDLF